MIYLSGWMYDSVDQGTWAIVANANVVRNAYCYNSSNADGDGVSFKAYFQAGTYTMKTIYHKAAAAGITKIKLDGSVIHTKDRYAAAVVYNEIATETGISVATDGIKTIQQVVDGQNVASGGFATSIYEIVFYRTA